jgi:hypothetical protein
LNISLTVAVPIEDLEGLKKQIAAALLDHSEGPWQVWLTPNESDPSQWRLRVSCPGYVTALSLDPGEQSHVHVLQGLQRILESPVTCLERPA